MKFGNAAAAAALFAVLSGLPATVQADQSVPFEVLARGRRAASESEPRLVVVRTGEELAQLWAGSQLPGSVPTVDFQRDMVAVYFMGLCPDVSFWVDVTGVTRARSVITIHVIGSHGGGGDAIVYPWAVIRLHKWPGEIAVDLQKGPRQ